MRRLTAFAIAVSAVAALSLSACSSNTSGSPSPSGAASSTNDEHRKVVTITFSGGTVSPIAEKLDVNLDDKVVLDITADVAGEIHVHSTPEQHIDYAAGHSQHPLDAFTFPTQIEVESHTLEKTILNIQVH